MRVLSVGMHYGRGPVRWRAAPSARTTSTTNGSQSDCMAGGIHASQSARAKVCLAARLVADAARTRCMGFVILPTFSLAALIAPTCGCAAAVCLGQTCHARSFKRFDNAVKKLSRRGRRGGHDKQPVFLCLIPPGFPARGGKHPPQQE